MAVSGTNTFSQTRNDIINRALSILGVKTRGRALTAEEVNEASDALNLFVKGLKSEGIYLWKYAEGTLFLTVGQESYTIDGSTANATESFAETTTSAAAVSGATAIVVTSATGFTAGYYVGVMQDDGDIFWTTVASVAGTTINLTNALTDDVSSAATVYVYQTKITRPEAITSARRRDSSDYDTPLNELARSDYFNLSQKKVTGMPTQFYYDKQLSYGTFYLYQAPDDATNTIKFTFQKMFFDFTTGNDNPDFPIEWAETLAFGLASRLTYDYGIDKTKAELIKRTADEMLRNLKGYDREDSIYFVPTYNLYQ
jgi:hypothetical protein